MALSVYDTFRRDPLFADWPLTSRNVMGTSDLVNLGTTDIVETDKSHLIMVSIPGVRDEDVSIDVQGDTLVVSGERRSMFEKDAGVNYLMRESSYGRFTRRFRLPEDADSSNITADHTAGLLTITLPKTTSRAKRAKVSINRRK